MKVKLYSVATITVFLAAMAVNTKTFTNNGSPPPFAGDPVTGQTCARSGCHGTNTLDGSSTFDVKIGTSSGNLVSANSSFTLSPSTDYFMSVSISGVAQIYGFAITALYTDNTEAGTFSITNQNQTRLTSSNNIGFVTQKNASATKNWIFKWKTKSTVSGPVKIYATVNLANGNGNAVGDQIYKREITINGTTSAINDLKELTNITVYPNPATQNITLSYNLLNNEYVSAQVMNSEGKVVKNLFGEKQNVGVVENKYNIADLAAGKYFVQISAAGKSTVKTLVKY